MSHSELDHFGLTLMKAVRDKTLDEWQMIADGKMKSDHSRKLHRTMGIFSGEQKKVLDSLAPEIVDLVVHNFLYMIEEHNELVLSRRDSSGNLIDLREESDGLAGELYGDSGWILKFSKRR